MKYFNLRSVLASQKIEIVLRTPTPSFYVATTEARRYIEPTFEKVEYQAERPTVLLVSAVGATGKTALAGKLSLDCKLPIFDLAKHKPVGANTLTGLLTDSFDRKDIGTLFEAVGSGAYGIIIDGIDEGRSKTTAEGFEAFLDDLAKLCSSSKTTTFVLLGRTRALEDCWLYLTDKRISTGLITIDPFTLDGAKQYIDTFTGGPSSQFAAQYAEARDLALQRLSAAFSGAPRDPSQSFLSFIGYPPVLDSIVTLLGEERNHHKLINDLGAADGVGVEINLLNLIARYILLRERELKVIPNIVSPLLQDAPAKMRADFAAKAFTVLEQAERLVAYCLERDRNLRVFGEAVLDERYEASIGEFIHEHPFLQGRGFRTPVFEAYALAALVVSGKPELESLAFDYLASRKHSYHLVYMIDTASRDHRIPSGAIGALLNAAMEFHSVHSSVDFRVDGPDWDDVEQVSESSSVGVDVEISVQLGDSDDSPRMFNFTTTVADNAVIQLGPRLNGVTFCVPCEVQIKGGHGIELIAPVEIHANRVSFDAKELSVRAAKADGSREVIIDAKGADGRVDRVTEGGATLEILTFDHSGLAYPLNRYAKMRQQLPSDAQLRRKYLRLRRILMEFTSHKKGALAKLQDKINHKRVLKNEEGRSVLDRLIRDGVIIPKGIMYFLNTERLASECGVSWLDLRKGSRPDSVLNYLRSIA